jgi:ribonuclease HI
VPTYTVYSDGACSGNPGAGGYAAIVVLNAENSEQIVKGGEAHTTNNRMEIMAVIAGLEIVPMGSDAQIVTDSQYVAYTMTKNWKRNKNNDLWDVLDSLVKQRRVTWQYVKGHAGHVYNERCDKLAVAEIRRLKANL